MQYQSTAPSHGDEIRDSYAKILQAVNAFYAVSVTQLIFHVQPGGAVAGSPFTQQPVVYAADGGGTPVASFTGNITISKQSGTGALSGTLIVACVAGVATFTNISFNTAGDVVLHATDGTHTVNSDSFTVASSDPLAGIPFTVRIETHNGETPLGLWKDEAKTIPATANADVIAVISGEFSSGAITLSQSTSGDRGTFLFQSRRPTVLFDGVNDFYDANNDQAGREQIFLLVNIKNTGSTQVIFDGVSNYHEIYNTGGNLNIYAGAVLSGGSISDGWHVIMLDFNGATSLIRIDGVQTGAGDAGSGARVGLRLGHEAGGASFSFAGSFIAELIPQTPLVGANITLVENYLATLIPPIFSSPKIAVIGDSISAGDSFNQECVKLLVDGVSVTQTNEGFGGTTTGAWQPGSSLFDDALAAILLANCTIVQLDLGTNDAAATVLLATFVSNMQAIITALVNAGLKVMINGLIPCVAPADTSANPLRVSYNGAIPALCDGVNVFLGDMNAYAYFLANPGELTPDGVHPTLGTGTVSLGGYWRVALLNAFPALLG